LAALIVVGSSTHPSGAGNEDFFQGKFNGPPYNAGGDDLVHVNFLTGPFGIDQALQANSGEPNAILASGWGGERKFAAHAVERTAGSRTAADGVHPGQQRRSPERRLRHDVSVVCADRGQPFLLSEQK
jgi:hypothetical protein